LVEGRFRKSDLKGLQVKPLLKELQKQKAKLNSGTVSKDDGDEDETEILYFEAADGTTFDIIDHVLKTAAGAGFTKFRLAVNRKS
jgi:hypothetical protein